MQERQNTIVMEWNKFREIGRGNGNYERQANEWRELSEGEAVQAVR
jgi:hypothetical protein